MIGYLAGASFILFQFLLAFQKFVLPRAPRKLIPFQPETSYIVPCAQRVALPHASEGMRH